MPDRPCTMCDGPVSYLGQLGSRHWFKCRDCGVELGRIMDDYDRYQDDQASGEGMPEAN